MTSPTTGFLGSMPPWVMLGLGGALGWVRNFWTMIYQRTIGQVTRRISVSVTVEEMDHTEAWVWLQYWAEKRLRERRISTLLLRRATVDQQSNCDKPLGFQERDSGYELVPAYGVYPFKWRNRYLLIFNSGKDEPTAQTSGGSQTFNIPRRRVTPTIWGTRDRNLLLDIIAEARSEWEAGHPTALHYFYHRYCYWNSRPMASRPRNTVYLPDGLIDDILSDAQQFLKSKNRYEPMGIPWRRGYLLFGCPGGGKTTLVQCLATELQLPLYYLSLAALRSREDLAGLLDDVRPGSLVLIEDVDCIAAAAERMNQSNEATTDGKQTNTPLAASPPTSESKITPSDLLNYIDGIIASQGRILVMTTNWPEKLDRALTRAGRVDRKWEITYAQKEELLAFHRAATAIGMTNMPKEDFLELLPDKATIADAQALLFRIEPAEVACETA